MTGIADLDAGGAALWEKVIASWADIGAHDRFIQHCHATTQLAAAGACYRARAVADPADAIAPKMQERIVFLSMQAMLPRSGAGAGRWGFFQSPWFVATILVSAALGAVLGFVVGGHR